MIAAAVIVATPWVPRAWGTEGRVPLPVALTLGVALALLGLTARPKQAAKLAKVLIQVAVVALGLGMNLRQVADAGLVGLAFAAGTIVGTFALGAAAGRLLGTERKLTTLLSSGTAICGGSAIAATASVIAATEAQIAVAMGCVFLLNAVAIWTFPGLGHALHMTQTQFGAWAAVAIHDVSSVVGAAKEFDKRYADTDHAALATQVATAVKLTRTLWIAPVAVACGWWFRRAGEVEGTHRAKVPVPWFVAWFLVAACVGTLFPQVAPVAAAAGKLAKESVMAVALLLIGCGLSVSAVRQVGWRALVLAVTLWVAISVAALAVVMKTIAG
jgi:uncharacterized integral membrane protein (TIGR00698 family)